jgi:glucosamine-6-phosphate deaminase
MRFIIRDNAEQASAYVANYIVDRIKHFNPTPSHPFVLGLPTGSSPLGVYKVLVDKYKAGEVSTSVWPCHWSKQRNVQEH